MKRLFTVLDTKGRELEAQIDIDRDELMFVWRAQLLDASNVVGVVAGFATTHFLECMKVTGIRLYTLANALSSTGMLAAGEVARAHLLGG